MKKKYLVNGLAVLALTLAATSCSNDDLFTASDGLKNAEEVLGLTIDPNQDWKMTTQVTANISVNLGTNQEYTIVVYDKNPIVNKDATYFLRQTVAEGGTISQTFSVPTANTQLYVVAFDSKHRSLMKQVNVTGNAIVANFGGEEATRSANPWPSMMTRAIQPSFNFPGDADASKFLDDVPQGIELLAPGIGKANHYIDETYEGELDVWGVGTPEGNWQDASGGILYVKGNCDFSNRSFFFGGNSELYLVKGATLILGENNGSGNLQSGTMIYIAEGAKLIANGELKLNNGLHIYNHGTIEAPQLSTNSNSVLYNVGTVTVTNKISVENELSVIVNDGTITAAELNTAGSGKFENNNKVTISGNTVVNSNDNTWVNNGLYKTGYFFYHAASDEVINNCKMIVDEDFNINLGDNPGNGCFKMDAGSSVVTKNFNGGGRFANATQSWVSYNSGPFYIYMGAKSLFKVTETATMCATKADYGIYGPETGGFENFAVFQAKDIVAGAGNQGYLVTYANNLAVVCETHFEQGWSGQYPYIDFKGNATIYPGENHPMDVMAIDESDCNPGFTPGEPEEVPEIPGQPEEWTFAFEDTFMGDYDLNDVVLRVKENAQNPNKIDVTLCATGASYNLYVYLDVRDNTLGRTTTRTLSMFNEEEVHAAMGQTAGKFVNTGSGSDKFVSGVEPVTFTFDKPSEDFDIATADFWIKSPQGNIHVGTTYKTGTAPYGLVIPGKWRWPKEWNTITGNSVISAPYPRFANFAADKNQDTDWYTDFDPDLVY